MTGTIFAQSVAAMGYEETPGCSCSKLQRKMDENGPDWCEANLSDLVNEIGNNYAAIGTKQRLLAVFVKVKIRGMLRSAIARARELAVR